MVVNGGRLFAHALKREGVEKIFTLAGGHIMPILYSCRDAGIEVIDFRHECAATYAADAYARVTGKPAVLTTTAGPGVTNTVSGMAEALYQGSPIIHIGGASPSASNDTGDEQDVNTLEIMSTVSKWARKIHYVQRIPEYVAMAFRHAMDARPGPVYLEIGLDVLCEKVNEDEVEYPENYRTQAEPFGDPMLVERAADMLIASQKPLIIVGDGVRFNAQHGEAIIALAEHLKIPVSVQTVCRGLFADEEKNPLFRFAGAESGADLVLMLDVENNFMVNKCRPPFFKQETTFIQVSPVMTRIGYNAPATLGIVGGGGPVASQIYQAVKAKTRPRETNAWLEEASAILAQTAQPYLEGFTSDAIPIHPGRCAWEVANFLNSEGRDWTVICDGGDAAEWIIAAVIARRPGQILKYGPNGTIGAGAGFVVGAWAANGKPLLYYTGDGSFGFYAMEFDTYCRLGIPLVCVISNDSAWGMIKHTETMANPEEVAKGRVGLELHHMRSYEKMAAMWDGYGVKVTRPGEIGTAIRQGFASGKPAIINVEIDKIHASPVTEAIGDSKIFRKIKGL